MEIEKLLKIVPRDKKEAFGMIISNRADFVTSEGVAVTIKQWDLLINDIILYIEGE